MSSAHKSHTRSLIRIISEVIGIPERGAEVGLWKGENSEALLEAFPGLHLVGVDAWDAGLARSTLKASQKELDSARDECFRRLSDFAPRMKIVREDSVSASSHIEDRSLDFIFIDGSHAYESVLRDVMVWWPKVRIGGFLSGHDYGGRGDRIGKFGVKRAVDEFSESVGMEVSLSKGHVWWLAKMKDDV